MLSPIRSQTPFVQNLPGIPRLRIEQNLQVRGNAAGALKGRRVAESSRLTELPDPTEEARHRPDWRLCTLILVHRLHTIIANLEILFADPGTRPLSNDDPVVMARLRVPYPLGVHLLITHSRCTRPVDKRENHHQCPDEQQPHPCQQQTQPHTRIISRATALLEAGLLRLTRRPDTHAEQGYSRAAPAPYPPEQSHPSGAHSRDGRLPAPSVRFAQRAGLLCPAH
jgi:hypothetical protein